MADQLSGYRNAIENYKLKENLLIIPFNIKSSERRNSIKYFLEANPHMDSILFTNSVLND